MLTSIYTCLRLNWDGDIITCVVIVMPICLWMESSSLSRSHMMPHMYASPSLPAICKCAWPGACTSHKRTPPPAGAGCTGRGPGESRPAPPTSQPTYGGVRLACTSSSSPPIDLIPSSENHACIHVSAMNTRRTIGHRYIYGAAS